MPNRIFSLAATLAGLALAAAPLAGCTSASGPDAVVEPMPTETVAVAAPESATPTPTPAAVETPEAVDCADTPTGRIGIPNLDDEGKPLYAPRLTGEITDTGVRKYAVGEPTLDADGQIVSYTVRSGDVLEVIAVRFCMDALSVERYNQVVGWIQPGDVLVLRPDPDVPWIPAA